MHGRFNRRGSRYEMCIRDRHNTICSATEQRQAEAARLAARNDVMIVVGCRESSNTRKLYEICGRLCKRTYAVESAQELSALEINGPVSIGITAVSYTHLDVYKRQACYYAPVLRLRRERLRKRP